MNIQICWNVEIVLLLSMAENVGIHAVVTTKKVSNSGNVLIVVTLIG